MKEPRVSVGIMYEPCIQFDLQGKYSLKGDEVSCIEGLQKVAYQEGKIAWNNHLYDELWFVPSNEDKDAFELYDVTIGINFHWERKENQKFQGALKIIIEDNKLTAVNVVRVEDYLVSVISSEMSATASLELLKAHAVISRSWLLAQIQKNKQLTQAQEVYTATSVTDEELIKWYDREDHVNFDVCADDHCQRYQGITRASTAIVREAIAATFGCVLTSEGEICDARFSKSCGGAFEEFQYCWEDKSYSYLQKQRDSKDITTLPDLRVEAEADQWIRTSPEAYCNTSDKEILSQVLNNYDQETTDFYRWKVEYSQEALSRLIRERSGVDYGEILDLEPIARGTSGRLYKLKIVGSKRTMIIGKELEIRRTLSPSHLYSSAFVIDKVYQEGADKAPSSFTLIGAGWGHGVGLCQIGAAVMGAKGFAYDKILLHYYIGADLTTLYTKE